MTVRVLPAVAAYAVGVQVATVQRWARTGKISPLDEYGCYSLTEVQRYAEARKVEKLRHNRFRDVGDIVLATRRAALQLPGCRARSTEQIRKACTPIACDVASRAMLYDVDEIGRILTERAA